MSTLRNAAKRIEHKERAQPASRKRLGLLEKHKDYVARAKDFHRKEDHLQLLREKAAFRNPDEFYFAMEHAQTKRGVHVVDKNKKYTHAQLEDMRGADLRYVQLRSQMEAKRIERLRANLQSAATTDTSGVLGKGAAASASRTHVRFDANGNADGGRGEKRPRQGDDDASTRTAGAGKSGANSEEEGEENGVRKKKIPRALHKVAVELSLRNKRLGHMKSLEQRLLLQQHQTQKGRRKKISFVREKENGKTEKVVQHVWKRERLK